MKHDVYVCCFVIFCLQNVDLASPNVKYLIVRVINNKLVFCIFVNHGQSSIQAPYMYEVELCRKLLTYVTILSILSKQLEKCESLKKPGSN